MERPVLDGLFVLGRGVVLHVGTGKGKLVVKSADGERLSGYAIFPEENGVLTRLLLWMYGAMPRVIHFKHPAFPYLQPSKKPGSSG